MLKRLLLPILVLFASSAFAQQPASKPPQPPEKAAASNAKVDPHVPKPMWLKHMQETLAPQLCKNSQYFVKCFTISQPDCVNMTQILVDACTQGASAEMPDQIDVQSGQYWGMLIARCTYDLYGKYLKEKKRDTPECAIAPLPKAPQTQKPAKP